VKALTKKGVAVPVGEHDYRDGGCSAKVRRFEYSQCGGKKIVPAPPPEVAIAEMDWEATVKKLLADLPEPPPTDPSDEGWVCSALSRAAWDKRREPYQKGARPKERGGRIYQMVKEAQLALALGADPRELHAAVDEAIVESVQDS
jgi:hypothetical protein